MTNSKAGILPLWKPRGMTSFQAVRKAGGILKTKKAGHTGTLDPDVDGVLPICVGRATKIVEYLTAAEKVYSGEVTMGWSTETEDASGETVDTKMPVEAFSEQEVDDMLKQLTGEQKQIPPMYSAVKVNGKRLYEYAREGVEVTRPIRTITVYSLERTSPVHQHDNGSVSFTFTCHCSKGTYIRTLAVTMGEKLGYPAHMSQLTRDASGSFSKEDCVTFEDMETYAEEQHEHMLLPIEHAFEHIPSLTVKDDDLTRILQGGILPLPTQMNNPDIPYFVIFDPEGRMIALYKKDPKRHGMMRPEKMILTANDM